MCAKENILNAAIELFSERGYTGISIREIKTLANIYLANMPHFGNKEELYKPNIFLHDKNPLISTKLLLESVRHLTYNILKEHSVYKNKKT